MQRCANPKRSPGADPHVPREYLNADRSRKETHPGGRASTLQELGAGDQRRDKQRRGNDRMQRRPARLGTGQDICRWHHPDFHNGIAKHERKQRRIAGVPTLCGVHRAHQRVVQLARTQCGGTLFDEPCDLAIGWARRYLPQNQPYKSDRKRDGSGGKPNESRALGPEPVVGERRGRQPERGRRT
jgi:hypothetical protein